MRWLRWFWAWLRNLFETPPPPPPPGPCEFAATVLPHEITDGGVALLTDVVIDPHEIDGCFDRVTFKFREAGGPPPCVVDVGFPPFTNTADEVVYVQGDQFVVVRFFPAWTVDFDDPAVPPTYLGPDSFEPSDTEWVRGVALVDAFEAVLLWAIGFERGAEVAVDAGDTYLTVTVRG